MRVFDAAAAAGDLDAALAVCRGELLAGLEDDWVLQARDAHAVALDALLARAADAATDPDEVLALARRRAELDPLGEEAHRALMRALAETGDAAAALAVFARLRERLARELGTAPSTATRELASELRATPTAALRPADDQAQGRLRTRAVAPLVGRDGALEALATAWAQTSDGTRRLALVSGEPGIGKTRLAAELVARVQAGGGAALAGRCTPEGHIPYAPFAEALGGLAAAVGPAALADAVGAQSGELARLVPSLSGAPPPGDPDGARHRLLAAVDAALVAVARTGGLVLVLDDLHWADEPTLGMLAHVAGAPERARLLVVATLRTTESRAAPALASLLASLRRDPAVLDLRLDGLSPEAAALLADAAGAGGHGAAIAARAGGNPLLVEELARAGVEPDGVPSGVRELVAEQVGRLGGPSAAVLATAAVAGAEFDLVTVERVAGAGALDALEAAVAAGLLTEVDGRPGRFAFTHALVRDAVASSLSAARRARTHGRIAEALTDAPPAELAHHWRAAADVLPGARERATTASRAAAVEALAALAFEEAARHLAHALDDLERGGRRAAARSRRRARQGRRDPAGAGRVRAGACARRRPRRWRGARRGGARPRWRRRDDPARRRRAGRAAGGGARRPAGRTTRAPAHASSAASASSSTTPTTPGGHAARRAAPRPSRSRGPPATRRRWAPRCTRSASRSGARIASTSVSRPPASSSRSGSARGCSSSRSRAATGTSSTCSSRATPRPPTTRSSATPRPRSASGSARGAGTSRCGAGAARPWPAATPRRSRSERRRVTLGTLAGDANAARDAWIQATAILFEQERYDELEEGPALAALESSAVPGAWHSGLAWVFAARGETERGRHHLDAIARDGWALLPRDANQLACLHECAEAAAYLGDAARGRELVAMLTPYASRCILNARAVNAYASGSYALGRAATAAGDIAAAAEHLRAGGRRQPRARRRAPGRPRRAAPAWRSSRRGGPGDRPRRGPARPGARPSRASTRATRRRRRSRSSSTRRSSRARPRRGRASSPPRA